MGAADGEGTMEQRSGAVRAVAGVDGSPASLAALQWAVDWVAGQGGGVVEAVHTWTMPYAYAPMGGALLVVEPDAIERAAKEELAAALQQVDARAGDGVELRGEVVEGAPAPSLLERAEGAGLLALGTRGRGGFTGLVLGSVSQQCLHHATCPVVVIPPVAGERR
jgi:nucleotide-binding universal stress UspA family protein